MSIRSPKISIAVLLVLCWTLLWAANRVVEFHARKDSQAVVLEWATEEESGLKQFHVQRRIDQSNWVSIGTVAALGPSETQNRYTYRDATLYKATNNGSIYYRLELELDDGTRLLHATIASTAGLSGVRHTWGSIKAMFR